MSRPDALEQHGRDAVRQLRSLADLVRWCASRFAEHDLHFGHGTDNAVDEAMALVLHALRLEPGPPTELFGARLTRAERKRVVALALERIRRRCPLPYLTGEAWFAGLRFAVDRRVLVPRSPLAEWLQRGFSPFLDPERVARVVDVGTGSGCIAVAAAKAFAHAEVDAVDASAAALEVAARNVAAHGMTGRVHLLEGDLLEPCEGSYDLIISNPPYVPRASYERLPAEYGHEPRAALVAGDDGLELVQRLLEAAPRYLREGGVLVVEVGEAAPALAEAFAQLPFLWLELERGGDGVFLLERGQLLSPAGVA